MPVSFNEDAKIFTLCANKSLYAIKIVDGGYLAHLWFGKNLPDADLDYMINLDGMRNDPQRFIRDKGSFMDALPFEYPCYGIGDYRDPALKITDAGGHSTCDIRYLSHKIYKGKPRLEGLPATFADEDAAQTLEIVCVDKLAGLEITLVYTAFDNLDVITRSVRAKNISDTPLTLTKIMSACLELETDDYDMITLNGSWARERAIERCRLHHGKQSVESMRGESSHQSNPFIALVSHNADEDNGECYGLCFVYSGNFIAQAEVTQHKRVRALMGINHADFSWLLEAGESFTAPETVLCYSDEGIGKMSRTYHDLFRSHLIRGEWKDKQRSILINNWEATYFDFDTDKLLSIAEQASKSGIEMFVLDDGWFGHRDSDNSSLGDWYVYEKKLKGGLPNLVEKINAMGMKFGLWFEPEMVSPDSDLYRAHPDWAIQIEGREMTQSRGQYVLDYTRKEVRDYVYSMIKAILDTANVEYIKWDMNRQLTEAGSAKLAPCRQKELWHRYVLGVYELLDRLTTEYPHLLLEGCSGGGARFDAGILYYSPQVWTSDDTDAIERLKIQHGTSICYPASAMGAHVSDCPNHAVGRVTPFSTRGNVALVGTFGYELDVTRIPQQDRDAIPQQIADFKKYNHLMRQGDQYRIGNMFDDNTWDAWMFVSKDKCEALFTYVQVMGRPCFLGRRVKLKGLDPSRRYLDEETGLILSGETLMRSGIVISMHGDFVSTRHHFVAQ